jgi:hypothetical protein
MSYSETPPVHFCLRSYLLGSFLFVPILVEIAQAPMLMVLGDRILQPCLPGRSRLLSPLVNVDPWLHMRTLFM